MEVLPETNKNSARLNISTIRGRRSTSQIQLACDSILTGVLYFANNSNGSRVGDDSSDLYRVSCLTTPKKSKN